MNSGGGSSWVEGGTEYQHVWFSWFVGIAKTNLSPDILTQPREQYLSLEKITQTSLKKQPENKEEKSTTTSVNLIFNLSE